MLLSLASWLQEHYPQNFGFLRVFQYHTDRKSTRLNSSHI